MARSQAASRGGGAGSRRLGPAPYSPRENLRKYTGLGEEPQAHTSLSGLEGVLRECCVLTGLQTPAVGYTTVACPARLPRMNYVLHIFDTPCCSVAGGGGTCGGSSPSLLLAAPGSGTEGSTTPPPPPPPLPLATAGTLN